MLYLFSFISIVPPIGLNNSQEIGVACRHYLVESVRSVRAAGARHLDQRPAASRVILVDDSLRVALKGEGAHPAIRVEVASSDRLFTRLRCVAHNYR